MRIIIARKAEGVRAATVIPGRMANLPPVQIRAENKETFLEGVRAAVDKVKSKIPFPP